MNRWLVRSALFVALLVGLVWLRVSNYPMPLPNPLAIDLVLDPGHAGESEPVISFGRADAADFLGVHVLDDHTVEFFYDNWGTPGLRTKPVPLPADRRLHLRMDLPPLVDILGRTQPMSSRAWMECNGTVILDDQAQFYVREPGRIFFGINPIGGTSCTPALAGHILAPDGKSLHGSPPDRASFAGRLGSWRHELPNQVVAVLLISLALTLTLDAVTRWPRERWSLIRETLVAHRWFVTLAAVATFCFVCFVTGGAFDFDYAEIFGNFYDYQAGSILHGRLDIPETAIGGEAFIAGGKLYGYFGPTPALLRLPFVVLGLAFGKLSRTFMLLYYVASLIAAYLILVRATRALAPDRATVVPTRWATALLVSGAGLGSTLFYLASRSYIYHEAIECGIAFALWSVWCSLRYLDEPSRHWWIGALVCGILSVQARPPTGLFALTLLGCVELAHLYRNFRYAGLPRRLIRHAAIGAACLAGVLTFHAVGYLKYGVFDGAPLGISMPYTTHPERFAAIQGKSFHLSNLPYNFYTYVMSPSYEFKREFPWLYIIANDHSDKFPDAHMDLMDAVLGFPYSMTSLFALATLGCAGAALARPTLRLPVLLLWAAAAPMVLFLFAAVATAQRYTGDFCPAIIASAAFGLAAAESAPRLVRGFFRALLVPATLVAILVTLALGLRYQADVWGAAPKAHNNYAHLKQRLDTWFLSEPPRP